MRSRREQDGVCMPDLFNALHECHPRDQVRGMFFPTARLQLQADRSIRQPIALEKKVFALQIGMPSHTPISDDTQKLQKDTETCIALPIHVTIWLLWYVHVAE